MDIKTYNQKKYLFIYRNTEIPDRYFITYDTEFDGNWLYEIATRSGPKYSVPPTDGPYAFPQLPLEKPLQYDADEWFVHFIQRDIAEYVKDEKKDFGEWGWYILKEIDIEKWKDLYQLKLTEQRKELQEVFKKENKSSQLKIF